VVNREANNDNTRSFVPITEGTMISHYKIVEKIGSGGMGDVYLAEDTELDRRVALKFLPLHLCPDEMYHTRFKREAQAVAKLNHPNIITIHEVSEYQGRPFFAMELVEGQSLRELSLGKELSCERIVELAIQICDGLSEAHEKEIVHRDIKPSNIVIDAYGRPKILDFGLAAIRGGEQITKTGSTLGTIKYMSPEQVEGNKVDKRSDLFSFGVVLYEMITARTPFERDNEAATLKSIGQDTPEPLARFKSDVPDEFQRTISKLLEKDRSLRYQSAADVISDLKKILVEFESGTSSKKNQPSIAVLPFDNLSADPEQEYFCDGMAEEIINALTQLEGLRVVARTSAFAFKGKHEDMREIGRKLSVSTLLEGSIRKAGGRVRITAQLINVGDGYHIWSERFDRDLEDVFAIQDEISLAIVEKLKVKLLLDEKEKMLKRYTSNLEAYDLYLKGRYHWNRRTRKSLKKAVAHFEQVIQKDPEYALAYAGLADCYSMLEQIGAIPTKEAFSKAKAFARKALEIDETSSEAHTSLAHVLRSYDRDWGGMEREFRRAIELNPDYATAHQWFARALLSLGRTSEAVQEIQRALELDPLSLIIINNAGWIYLHAGQEEKALEYAEKILDIDPTFGYAHVIFSTINERKGRYDEAVDGWLKVDSFSGLFNQHEISVLRESYASSGWTGYLRKRLEMALPKADQHNIASLYARLGDSEKAIEWLKKYYEEYGLRDLLTEISYDKLRSDPRFIEITKKMGLPRTQ
jgi:serine/threonine protein kinase/tetratricopeptide (TPR) repeat protein